MDGRCERCGRPAIPSEDYHDRLESLAWEVISAAHDEYRDLRGTADTGPELKRAIVNLANSLIHYHYDGDGCLDDAADETSA